MVKKHRKLKKRVLFVVISGIVILIGVGIYLLFFRISAVNAVTSEVGEEIDVVASDFLKNCHSDEATLKTDLSTIDTSIVGEYPVEIEYRNKVYQSKLVISDTTAPTATLVDDLVCYIGSPIEAQDCVKDIVDYSSVEVSFEKDYAFDEEKDYTVKIVLTDEYDNKTVYTTQVTVKKDDEAPIVDNNVTLYVIKDTTDVDYTEGLSYSDNVSSQEDIQVTVDDSEVDVSNYGKYEVTIDFVDEVGNVTQVQRDVVVYSLDTGEITIGQQSDSLDTALDQLLDQIITDDMTDKEKLSAFYQWALDNLKYKNNGEKDYKNDITGNMPIYAEEILTKQTGHCFHYAALEVYVMNKLNIPVILVEGGGHNVYGEFELHYWTMVQLEGVWYHFDPLFEQLYKYTRQFFLVSSSQIYNSSHTWTKSAYPWS